MFVYGFTPTRFSLFFTAPVITLHRRVFHAYMLYESGLLGSDRTSWLVSLCVSFFSCEKQELHFIDQRWGYSLLVDIYIRNLGSGLTKYTIGSPLHKCELLNLILDKQNTN